MDPEKASNTDNTEEDVEEEEDGSELIVAGKTKNQLTSAVLRNPQVLAALQSRINSMVGQPSDYIQVHEHDSFIPLVTIALSRSYFDCSIWI